MDILGQYHQLNFKFWGSCFTDMLLEQYLGHFIKKLNKENSRNLSNYQLKLVL